MSGFERNVTDSVLNALDSEEAHPFDLRPELLENKAQALSPAEMAFFETVARNARRTIEDKTKPAMQPHAQRPEPNPAWHLPDDLEHKFVQGLVWGYRQAQQRFPQQALSRQASRELAHELALLELSEVPVGHVITVTLTGHDCTVTYSDADAEFLQANEVMTAHLMTWHSCESGYPAQHVTLHRTPSEYVEHVSAHFETQAEDASEDAHGLIPAADSSGLTPVYVRDTQAQALLKETGVVTLPLGLMHLCDYTPRGVRLI